MVVAQVVERSLPTPEIRGLNPIIGTCFIYQLELNRKGENKEKEAGHGPSLKIFWSSFGLQIRAFFSGGNYPSGHNKYFSWLGPA